MAVIRRSLVLTVIFTFCLLGNAGTAGELLDTTGVKGGLVVVVGCKDPGLLNEFGKPGFLVQGYDAQPANVLAARKAITKANIHVAPLSGGELPLVDELVNLLVVADPGIAPAELQRVLAPRGMIVGRAGVKLPNGATPLPGGWTAWRKPVPDEIDEWTHFRHGADGNMVSRDLRIGPPRRLQWMCGPIFQRHHGLEPSITESVSAGGRLFYIIDEAPQGAAGLQGEWRLVARDGFNGILLWKRAMQEWGAYAWSYWSESHAARFNHPLNVRKRLVAVGNRVYVTLGFNRPISALDAATGVTVRTYTDTQYADEFVVDGGVIYACVNDRLQKPWPGKGVRPEPPLNPPKPSIKHVLAIDAESGKLLWKAGPFVGNPSKIDRMASMRHLSLTVGGTGVFLVDEKDVVGLNRASGAVLWRSPRLAAPKPLKLRKGKADPGLLYHLYNNANLHAVVYADGRLLVMHPTDAPTMKYNETAILQALDPMTGKELWRYAKATPIEYINPPDVFAVGDRIWLPDKKAMTLIELDAATGKELKTYSIKKALDVRHHHRCYPNRATTRYAILSRRGAEFVDFKTGELTLNHWMRTGCRMGHLLANGFTYRPPDHCRCYMSFQPRGFLALRTGSAGTTAPRLVKGPAYDQIEDVAARPTDWPAFRADPMRSAMTASPIPAQPTASWKLDLKAKLTPPVVAEGNVIVASPETDRVYAIDAASGKAVWQFTAAGPIDSPPAIWNGRVIFGCCDGWVYCLRTTDGAVVWRFRAAPSDRQIIAFGRLQSPWPVCGSVLVADGKAWFVAGRSSLLDDGVIAYALDIRTGAVLTSKRIREIQTDTQKSGALPTGALGDVLTTDGTDVYLHKRKLDLAVKPAGVTPTALAAVAPRISADGGFTTDRWFHRAFWQLQAGRTKVTGNLIAFDAENAYAVAANAPGAVNKTFHIPAGGVLERIAGMDGDGPSWLAKPNVQTGGTILFATGPGAAAAEKKSKDRKKSKSKQLWLQQHFPMYPWAMAVGADKLVAAGIPGKVDAKDPWAGFEGRQGGKLAVLAKADGKILSQLDLAAPPVWNGMAAADGKLYLALMNGQVVCYSAQ